MTAKTSVTTTTPFDSLIGTEIVVLRPADFPPFHDILPRGAIFRVTAEIIAGSMDRLSNSWLRYLDDPDAQERRWGEQLFARADVQEQPIHEWVHGDALWERLYGDRRRSIIATTGEGTPERRAAFQALEDEFGEPLPTSTILSTVAGDDGSEAVRR